MGITNVDKRYDFEMTIKDIEDDVRSLREKSLDKFDIVNDLTTGGTDRPLSAEQGKMLNTSLDDLKKSSAECVNEMAQKLSEMGLAPGEKTLKGVKNSFGVIRIFNHEEDIWSNTKEQIDYSKMVNRHVMKMKKIPHWIMISDEIYTDGYLKIIINTSNLLPENIKSGVNVGGVIGTYSSPKLGETWKQLGTVANFESSTIAYSDGVFVMGFSQGDKGRVVTNIAPFDMGLDTLEQNLPTKFIAGGRALDDGELYFIFVDKNYTNSYYMRINPKTKEKKIDKLTLPPVSGGAFYTAGVVFDKGWYHILLSNDKERNGELKMFTSSDGMTFSLNNNVYDPDWGQIDDARDATLFKYVNRSGVFQWVIYLNDYNLCTRDFKGWALINTGREFVRESGSITTALGGGRAYYLYKGLTTKQTEIRGYDAKTRFPGNYMDICYADNKLIVLREDGYVDFINCKGERVEKAGFVGQGAKKICCGDGVLMSIGHQNGTAFIQQSIPSLY